MSLNQMATVETKNQKIRQFAQMNIPLYKIENVYGNGHIPYYKNMIRTLQGISEPCCNGEEGLKSLELIIGAYKSHYEKKIVNFPLSRN